MTTGKAVLGVLAGIAAGTVIGVLLAPDKGRKMRRRLSRKSEDLIDAVNSRIDEKFEELLTSVTTKMKRASVLNEGRKSPEKELKED